MAPLYSLPENFEGLDPEDAVAELNIALDLVLRETVKRQSYLDRLMSIGALPLSLHPRRREALADALSIGGCNELEISAILDSPREPVKSERIPGSMSLLPFRTHGVILGSIVIALLACNHGGKTMTPKVPGIEPARNGQRGCAEPGRRSSKGPGTQRPDRCSPP